MPGDFFGCSSWVGRCYWRLVDRSQGCWSTPYNVYNHPSQYRITQVKPVNPKGIQPWIFIGRTDAVVEAPILCLPDARSWLIGKDPDAGKDWGQEEKGITEDEMVGWHHRLDGHEFEQAPGVGDGQGSLACCSPWGDKESDMTEWLNWTELLEKTLESALDCKQIKPVYPKGN